MAGLRDSQIIVMLAAISVVVGMWLERFGIVVESLHRNRIPSAWGEYWPTFWDWSLFVGTIGLFFAGFLLFVRLLPVISLFELRELVEKKN